MGLGSGKQNKARRFTGGGRRPDRTSDKRMEAAERNEEWAGLPAAKQLAELDRRLGKGVGARRQRARLARASRAA
jgi:hypothetical protein